MSFRRQTRVQEKRCCSDPLPCGPFLPFMLTIQSVYTGLLLRYKTLGMHAVSVKLKAKTSMKLVFLYRKMKCLCMQLCVCLCAHTKPVWYSVKWHHYWSSSPLLQCIQLLQYWLDWRNRLASNKRWHAIFSLLGPLSALTPSHGWGDHVSRSDPFQDIHHPGCFSHTQRCRPEPFSGFFSCFLASDRSLYCG